MQVFWPPDDECSVAASGGVGSTSTITVTDMQVHCQWARMSALIIMAVYLKIMNHQGSLFILGGGLFLAFLTMLLECLTGSNKWDQDMWDRYSVCKQLFDYAHQMSHWKLTRETQAIGLSMLIPGDRGWRWEEERRAGRSLLAFDLHQNLNLLALGLWSLTLTLTLISWPLILTENESLIVFSTKMETDNLW